MDTDLTDEQWELIKKLIPRPKKGGRRRTTCERKVVNSIFYLVKTGCQWRQLCRYHDLPWQTVYRYFIAWRRKGVWKKMHFVLFQKVRSQDKRKIHPTVVVIDSQSTRTGKLASCATRGYDGGKRVKGRKRHFVVDTNGLLVDVSITPANVHDNKGARKVLRRIIRREEVCRSIKTICADKGYSGEKFSGWVTDNVNARVKIGQNHAKIYKKFIPEKKRWVVERTFAWIRDYRRLTEDTERELKNSVTMIRVAFIRVMLRKLAPTTRQWT